MTEQAEFVHGLVQYPLPLATDSGNSILRDADPALYYVLDYCASVLQTYIGARLAEQATIAELAGANAITQAVAYKIPYDPETVFAEQQIGKWPLLAIWRETGKYRWRTVARMETQATWRIAYVLPPLTGAQRERIAPILNSVPKVLLNRIEQKFDPAYQDGADFLKLAGLDEIDLIEDNWGSYDVGAPGQPNLKFPVWMGKLFVVERDENLPASATGGKVTGVDISIPIVASSSAPLDGIVDVSVTFPDPTTIAGCELLYRADEGVALDSSSTLVASLADQSGNAHNATAPTNPNRPYFFNDESAPLVRFDGVEMYLTATDASLGADTGKTLVALFRLYDTAHRSAIVVVTDGTTNGSVAIEANTFDSSGGLLGLWAGGSSYDTQFPADTLWHVAVVRITDSTAGDPIASTVTMSIDGAPAVLTKKSGSGNWYTLAAATTFAIGAQPALVSTTTAAADIGVAIAFSAKLSDSDAAVCVDFCNQWLSGTV